MERSESPATSFCTRDFFGAEMMMQDEISRNSKGYSFPTETSVLLSNISGNISLTYISSACGRLSVYGNIWLRWSTLDPLAPKTSFISDGSKILMLRSGSPTISIQRAHQRYTVACPSNTVRMIHGWMTNYCSFMSQSVLQVCSQVSGFAAFVISLIADSQEVVRHLWRSPGILRSISHMIRVSQVTGSEKPGALNSFPVSCCDQWGRQQLQHSDCGWFILFTVWFIKSTYANQISHNVAIIPKSLERACSPADRCMARCCISAWLWLPQWHQSSEQPVLSLGGGRTKYRRVCVCSAAAETEKEQDPAWRRPLYLCARCHSVEFHNQRKSGQNSRHRAFPPRTAIKWAGVTSTLHQQLLLQA